MTTIVVTILSLVILPVPVWLWLRRQDARAADVRREVATSVRRCVEGGWTPSLLDVHTMIRVAARERRLVLLPTAEEILEDVAAKFLYAHVEHLPATTEAPHLAHLAQVRTLSKEVPAPRLAFAPAFLIGSVAVCVGVFLLVYLPVILGVSSPLRDMGRLSGLVTDVDLFWDELVGGVTILFGGGVASRLLAGARVLRTIQSPPPYTSKHPSSGPIKDGISVDGVEERRMIDPTNRVGV